MSVTPKARQQERDRQRPYSAESYAAQYGITVKDAEAIRSSYQNHKEIVRHITQMFAEDSDLRRRALMLDRNEMDADEIRRAEEVLAGRSWREVGKEMV